MTDIPAGAKKPADRKSKAEDAFSFEFDGETYTLKPTYDVLTPGWFRANRRRDDMDAFFTIMESLSDEETLAKTLDKMDKKRFEQLQKDFYKHLEVLDSGE